MHNIWLKTYYYIVNDVHNLQLLGLNKILTPYTFKRIQYLYYDQWYLVHPYENFANHVAYDYYSASSKPCNTQNRAQSDLDEENMVHYILV